MIFLHIINYLARPNPILLAQAGNVNSGCAGDEEKEP